MSTKVDGSTRPTTTTKTQSTTGPEPQKPAKVEEEHPDAVGIGDVAKDAALSVAKDVLDPLGMFSRTKSVVDGVVGLVTGKETEDIGGPGPLDTVKGVADMHRGIDNLKPGEEIEIGRKLELGAETIEGESEVKVGVERDANGYVVTMEVSGAAAEAYEGEVGHHGEVGASAGVGTTATVTYRVKTAEEAKNLVDNGIAAVAAGAWVPGADALVVAGSAAANAKSVESVTVSVDANLAAEAGLKLPESDEHGSGSLGIEGEATASYAMRFEPGPPRVVYAEATLEAEAGAGVVGLFGNENVNNTINSKATAVEGSVTVRYAIAVDANFDPKTLKTPEGQKAMLAKAKESGSVSIAAEGEAHIKGGHVVTVEREAEGKNLDDALNKYRATKPEIEVKKETSSKVGSGIKSGGGTIGLELAYDKRENVSAKEKEKVLNGG